MFMFAWLCPIFQDAFSSSLSDGVVMSQTIRLSSRANARDLRFLAALEMTQELNTSRSSAVATQSYNGVVRIQLRTVPLVKLFSGLFPKGL